MREFVSAIIDGRVEDKTAYKIERANDEYLRTMRGLKPKDFVLFDNIKCAEHYTFVCQMSKAEIAKFGPLLSRLKEIDSTMIFNPIDKLHLTIFHCDMAVDIEKLKAEVRNHLLTLSFRFEGMGASNTGIGILAVPSNGSLISLRKKLYLLSGKEWQDTARCMLSWVTLARSTSEPTQELIDFLANNMHAGFGSFVPKRIDLYRSRDKNLIMAEKIAEFEVGGTDE